MNYTVVIPLEEWRCIHCHRYYCSEKYNNRCAMCATDKIDELTKRISKLKRQVISYRAILNKKRK